MEGGTLLIELLPIRSFRIGKQLVGLGKGVAAEIPQRIAGWSEVGQPASRCQDHHPITKIQALHAMSDHNNAAATVGQLAQQMHQGALISRIEPRRGLIQEQQ